MKLRCFVVDAFNCLCAVSPRLIDQIWEGKLALGCLPGITRADGEIRTLSILCDNQMHPKITYFLRLLSDNGKITPASRAEAMQAAEAFNRLDFAAREVQVQLADWPADWRTQAAVALDVCPNEFSNYGLGCPRLLAELFGVTAGMLFRGYSECFEAPV